MASEIESPLVAADSGKVEPVSDRRIVMLPDTRFFVRTVPVAAEATAVEVSTQVELALETLSPFPVAQLYHGHFWKPGQPQALVFAAFRRRFTAEETAEWGNADLVIPAFAGVVGLAPAPGTTVIISGDGWLTAVHWSDVGPIPSRVLTEPVSPESTEDDRRRVRDEMIRTMGSVRVVELAALPMPAEGRDEDDADFDFTVGEKQARLPAVEVDAIDVRDKGELLARRGAKARDVLIWRGVLGLIALILLGVLAEGGLVALKYWQRGRVATVARQQPAVEKVMANQAVTRRIQQFSESLRPFEMIDAVGDKPESIYFLTTEVREHVLTIDAITRVAPDVGVYEASLRNSPALSKVELSKQGERDGVTTFTLTLTFKPEALHGGAAKP